MQAKDSVQHVYLVGAKSLGSYGGYETFVYKLTEYHQNKKILNTMLPAKPTATATWMKINLTKLQKLTITSLNFTMRIALKLVFRR